jgi:hypothetical protein
MPSSTSGHAAEDTVFSWPALLIAPLVALGQLSIAYSLVTPECMRQGRSALHGVAVVSLLLVLAMTAMAWLAWRRHASAAAAGNGAGTRVVTRADGSGASERPHFVELIAVLVGALSALVCVALWLPIWLLSPCY